MDQRDIVGLYVDKLHSMRQITEETGVPAHSVNKALVQAGVQKRPRGPVPLEFHPLRRGGVTIDKSGYVLRLHKSHPNANYLGYVREHRLVMEKKLGRYLEPEEVVHHIDGDRGNNAQSNLELYETNGHHLAHELKGKCPDWTKEGKAAMQAGADRKKKLPQDREEFAQIYRTMRVIDIAKKYGAHKGTVAMTAKRFGIPVSQSLRRLPAIEKEELVSLYEIHTAEEIGKMKGIHMQTVYNLLKRFGIQTHWRRRPRQNGLQSRPE